LSILEAVRIGELHDHRLARHPDDDNVEILIGLELVSHHRRLDPRLFAIAGPGRRWWPFASENELLKRIDAYAERVEGNTPGLKLTRADAVRVLLVRGLAK